VIGAGLLQLLALAPIALQAPHPASGTGPAITPAALRRHIQILADDSMGGRGTPSPGLERAAAYVSREFARLGLSPAGDTGYAQRWAVSRWVPDDAGSLIELAGDGWQVSPGLGAEVRLVGGTVGGAEVAGEVLLLDDPPPPGAALDPRLRDRIVLLPVDFSRPLRPDLQQRVDRLARQARAVVILSNRDSATFAARLAAAAEPRLGPDFRLPRDGAPVLEVHRRAFGTRDPARITRARIRLARRVLARDLVPNLVGTLEGSDPRLRREYVAISAHLDGVGLRPGAADSINNGADDNASGVAALLAIAGAFSAPEARPRRSLLFLVPSGEERGLWGSDYYVHHPTVPLDRIVATLNMDLIGRNWTDSVIVVGPDYSSLGATLRGVQTAHPELRMAAIADRWPEERIFYRSDHYHFARRGVPILFFTSGTHPDYHQPTDSPDRVDVEKASRIARLLYHVAAAVAGDSSRPRWNPESYRRIVEDP
jgi:hypothetical protein